MLPLPAVMLGVPVPANVTSVPSHTADVGVVFVAALGNASTVPEAETSCVVAPVDVQDTFPLGEPADVPAATRT